MNHTGAEEESGRVLEFLKEVYGQPFDHERPDYYGHVATLNEDTARLCLWLQLHPNEIPSMSLELQLWWKRHQEHDRKRAIEAQRRIAEDRLRAEALAKLTPEELAALGVKR